MAQQLQLHQINIYILNVPVYVLFSVSGIFEPLKFPDYR